MYQWEYETPIGGMIMTGTEDALTGLRFCDVSEKLPEYEEKKTAVFEETALWLDTYFGGGVPEGTPKLRLEGTGFRKRVWDILSDIPYGNTMTYGEIARMISGRMSAQAVGNAVGSNPVSIIVPCHRVLGRNGMLIGYGGGIWRKVRLLEIEGILKRP